MCAFRLRVKRRSELDKKLLLHTSNRFDAIVAQLHREIRISVRHW
jgi:hypothetical protein